MGARNSLIFAILTEYFTLGKVEATMKDAYLIGRHGSLAKRFWEQLVLIFKQILWNAGLDLPG